MNNEILFDKNFKKVGFDFNETLSDPKKETANRDWVVSGEKIFSTLNISSASKNELAQNMKGTFVNGILKDTSVRITDDYCIEKIINGIKNSNIKELDKRIILSGDIRKFYYEQFLNPRKLFI